MQLHKIIILLVLMGSGQSLLAQKYFTKTGAISFFSGTPIEDIEATSNSASTVIDMESGKIQWAVLIKSFEFEKALMQEHFNENYMESSTYPKAKFSGALDNFQNIDLSKDGTYTTQVKGKMTIHGVTKEVTSEAVFTVSEGEVKASCALNVLVADYNIEIPTVVASNIAEEIEIKINANYARL